jgi:transposase
MAAKNPELRNQILALRDTMSYRDIEKKLGCSKGTINYHCGKNDLLDTGKKKYPLTIEKKKEIHEFCKTNSNSVAQKHFNVSLSTIHKYKDGGFLNDLEETEQ